MNTDYITDEEMLYMIEENNEDAVENLIKKYSNLIDICVKKYNNNLESCGLEEKDLYQEGLLGLLEASRRYDKGKDVKFKTYASTCIESNILSLIRTAKRKKHNILNESYSLDKEIDGEIDAYSIIKNNEKTPEEKLIIDQILEETYERIKKEFTSFEYQVFILNIKGYKNEEIAKILDKNTKSIENTLQRIKIKMKTIKKNL